MKTEERAEARRLRAQEGQSIKEIARRLSVSVSSVSVWTRDVELTEEQHALLQQRNHRHGGQTRGHQQRAARARVIREQAQAQGRELARAGDLLHHAGCMLFWAEGSKCRNAVRFTNSDVDMLGLFVVFLRRCYAVAPDRILLTVNCHLNNGLGIDEIHGWWLDKLGLPASAVRTPSIGRASKLSRFKRNTLPYGTARVTVHSTFIVQSIYGAIQEYAGIQRPEWVDCTPPHRASDPMRVNSSGR